jgi:hypothetical protein
MMIAFRAADSFSFLANQVSKRMPKRVAPYNLAVRAAAELKAVPNSPSNWLGKNNSRGATPRQTTALMIMSVMNFIASLLSD